MIRARSRIGTTGIGLLIGAILFSGGCAEELGPVRMPVTRVHGVVKDGKRPISGGWIEFMPVSGTVGNLRSARLGSDGSFDADGVAIGENAIRLVNDQIDKTPALWQFGTYRSPMRRTIPAASSGPLNINLVEEAIRSQEASKNRSASTHPVGTGEAP